MTNETNRIMLVVALAAALSGCASGTTEDAALGVADQGLAAANGLSPNGLMRNGLMRNGLMRNGLSENGLMRNGLGAVEFQAWFDEDPVTAAAVMTYLVRCAAPAGQSVTFLSATTGVTYTWTGVLGLAPGFASGLAPTEAEQQVVSACLAAHVNKYGREITVSVLGAGATGLAIPIGKKELTTYSQREGCFAGNLFLDEGISVGLDHVLWARSASSARACAFDVFGVGPSADCPPIDNIGFCGLECKADPTGTYYTSCWRYVNGAWKSYLPITTRIAPADVYKCGDGTCQFTEQCGTGTTYDSCQADCGVCPIIDTTKTTSTPTTTTRTKNGR